MILSFFTGQQYFVFCFDAEQSCGEMPPSARLPDLSHKFTNFSRIPQIRPAPRYIDWGVRCVSRVSPRLRHMPRIPSAPTTGCLSGAGRATCRKWP